jgi:hypothetical protein
VDEDMEDNDKDSETSEDLDDYDLEEDDGKDEECVEGNQKS